MALPEALSVLSDHWVRFQEQLDDAALSRLHGLTAELEVAPSGDARVRILHRIVELAIQELPVGDGIRRALDRALTEPRLAGAPPDWASEIALTLPARKPTGEATVLAARSVSATSMRRRGGDPDQAGLIRLRHDGQARLPGFQFSRSGKPHPLVLRINLLLDADADPWGAADWWLCPNVWLAGKPANLIDRLDEDTLVAAALAAVEG